MATNWPTSRDTFTNPSSGDTLDSPSHAAQHANINDAVEAMQAHAGLVLVKPSGAVNGTVGANGAVTIGTAVSSVTVNDAFSSTFDNYRITITNMSHSANQPDIQIRFGSATTSYYTTGWYLGITAGSITALQSGSSSQISFASGNNAGSGSYALEVLSPYRSEPTFTQATNMSTAWANTYCGTHTPSTSFTSFIILPSSGTLSAGTIRVYGYNNG